MRLAMGAMVVCGVLCFGVAAKQAAPTSTDTQPKQTVVLQLMLGGQTPARITVMDGGTARITVSGKQRLGLVPALKEGSLDVDLVEFTKDPATGVETSRNLRRLTLLPGENKRFEEADVPVDVEWQGTKAAATQTASATASSSTDEVMPMGPRGCGNCCITCGEYQICACGVETPCGSCCCIQCCEGMEGAAHAASSTCSHPPAVVDPE